MDIQQSFERDLLDLVRKYVAERESYWRDWNGRAANRAAELEAENQRLRELVEQREAQWKTSDAARIAVAKDAERYRLARKLKFLTDRQLLSIDAAMKGGE